MRTALCLALATFIPCTALAQGAAAPPSASPAAPASVARNPLAASYAAMPEQERIAIQNDLIWTGDFNATPMPEFGERATAAVKAFQKRQEFKETGVLNPPERALLAAAAKKRQEAVGWTLRTEPATGIRLGVPGKLVPQAVAQNGDTRWTSARGEVRIETFKIAAPGTTLQRVHEAQRKIENRKLNYNILRPDFFVLAGLQGLKKFYTRAHLRGEEVRGFTLLYDQAMEVTLDPIAVAMSASLNAFPQGATAVPPPRRKVEYATGVVIGAEGYVLTAQSATDGCQTITLSGIGPAELVAIDKSAGLALLRIYGARNMPALMLGTAAPGEASAVGISDPQMQGGSRATTSLPVRVTASAGRINVDPAPAAGFAGAAVLGRDGNLAGVLDLKPQFVATAAAPTTPPQATLIPAEAIAKFAAAHSVPLAQTTPTDAKAAVAQVICVRK